MKWFGPVEVEAGGRDGMLMSPLGQVLSGGMIQHRAPVTAGITTRCNLIKA